MVLWAPVHAEFFVDKLEVQQKSRGQSENSTGIILDLSAVVALLVARLWPLSPLCTFCMHSFAFCSFEQKNQELFSMFCPIYL